MVVFRIDKTRDYTTKGFAAICKDGIDSISSCIKELEKHGYIIRERVSNEKRSANYYRIYDFGTT